MLFLFFAAAGHARRLEEREVSHHKIRQGAKDNIQLEMDLGKDCIMNQYAAWMNVI